MISPTPRRLAYLTVLAAILGLFGGGASWVLLRLIGLLSNLALLHEVGWELPSLAGFRPGIWIVPTAMAGALVVSLLAKWAPVIRGHGIPEAMEAVLVRQSRISPRAAIAKPVSAAVAIGTGGPFGAEGPIIVTGGALGSIVGQVLHVSPAERKILLAAGAAAGMAATFGAPLAAVVLAIELLLFEFSVRAFVPLAVAASIAAGVHAAYASAGPLFDVPAHDYSGLADLPVFFVLGLACGLLATVVCKGLFVVEAGYRRLPFGEFWHPIVGAAAFGLVGLAVPRALGVGYDVIDDALASRFAVGALAVLLVGKLLMWWIALGSGTSGGTLAPVLLVGASFGALFAEGWHEVMPSSEIAPASIVLVAMAATFGAATRATFTAIVFAFELTGDYEAILPLIIAVVVADLVAGALLDHGLMTEKLARRGLDVPRAYQPDLLSSTRVADAMTREVVVIAACEAIGSARTRFVAAHHSAYPIVDDGRCVGIVTRGDLLTKDMVDGDPVTAVASADVVTVRPEASLLDALHVMIDEGIEHLPVVDDDDRLVGILTRTDILVARVRHDASERREPGWLARANGRGISRGTRVSAVRAGPGSPPRSSA